MRDIGKGGYPLSECLSQGFKHLGAGTVKPNFQWRVDGRALVDPAHQNLRLGVLPIDFFLEAPDQVVGLILIPGQHQAPRPARHAFYVGAQVVIELGWTLPNRPVDPANERLGTQLGIDLYDQRQGVVNRRPLGQFDVEIHLVTVGAGEKLQG